MSRDNEQIHDEAVIKSLQAYGVAMEVLGRSRTGSPRGAASMMRFAEKAARGTLYALLGREPTIEEIQDCLPHL